MKKSIIAAITILILISLIAVAQEDNSFVTIGTYRTIESKILGETRTVMIGLPYNYEEKDIDYPVLYLLDSDTGLRFAKMVSVVYELCYDRIPPAIVVGIKNTNRRRDMFPGNSLEETAGADKFLAFLKDELQPLIDSNYRTNDYNILTGHSNSALFASYAMLKETTAFDAILAISPMIGYRKEVMMALAENFQGDNYIYIQYSDDDFDHVLNAVPEFIQKLDQTDVKLDSDIIHEGGHVPFNCYYDSLTNLFKGYKIPADQMTDSMDDLISYYKKLSESIGFEFEIPSESFLSLAMNLEQADKTNEAIAVYQRCLESYPENIQVMVGLGRVFEKIGEKEKAIFYYKKVLEIYPMITSIKDKVEKLSK